MCQQLVNLFFSCSLLQNPEFGTSEAFSEAQQNISEMEESIREVNVKVARSEARLEALREVGIDVGRWIEKAQEKVRGDRHTSDVPGGLGLPVHVHTHTHTQEEPAMLSIYTW